VEAQFLPRSTGESDDKSYYDPARLLIPASLASTQETMKVALLYPPDRCLPTIPYSSLATLSACLKEQGHEVLIRDLNVEVFDWLADGNRLAGYFDYAVEVVEGLESKPRLDSGDANIYRFLAPLVAAPRDDIVGAPTYIEVMRSPELFYVPEKFNRAFDALQTMIRVVYAANPVFNPENRFFVRQNIDAVRQPLGDPIADAYAGDILNSLLADEPDLVGFTMPFSFQFFEMLKLARLIKERSPKTKIVVGGPTINDYAYRLFESADLFEFIDFAVAGEGERSIMGLTDAMEGKIPFEDVPNLYWCEDGQVKKSPLPPDVPDLNSFPTPDFEGVPFDRYLSPARIANLQTSRGCYYGKCTFCGDGFRRNFRLRAPGLIYQDIKAIHEKCGVEYFLFWDSLAPPKTLKHVSRMIRDNGDDIKWFAETKSEKPYTNPELIQTLRDGGCRFLQFGFESGSQRVLDLIDKGNDIERVDTILSHMKRSGINAGVSWFIGFPTEEPDEALLTYDFVNDRDDRISLSVYAGTFMLGRDTLVYENPDRYGINILEQEDGGIDYEMKDGTAHYDRTDFDHAFRARGDLPLLNHGGYLLYAANKPEHLRAITGLGRYGKMSRNVVEFDQQVAVISEGVGIRDYPFNPFATDPAKINESVRVAYYAKTGIHFPLRAQEDRIIRAVDGQRSVREILEAAQLDDGEDHVRTLVDRGLLSLPRARYVKHEPISV
jgi:radical SAM superfamily enzyme YgiQ (UPF0313 family)